MIAQICGAVELALEYFADHGEAKSVCVVGVGSLSSTNNADLLFCSGSCLSAAALLFYIKPLSANAAGRTTRAVPASDIVAAVLVLFYFPPWLPELPAFADPCIYWHGSSHFITPYF